MKSPNKHIPKFVDVEVLKRQIPCSSHDLATCWIVPDELRPWLSVDSTSTLESMTVEPGCTGDYSFVWQTENRQRTELYGRFVSLNFPHQISFTCSFQSGPMAGHKPPEPNCLIEVDFKDVDAGCELTLTFQPLQNEQTQPTIIALWTKLIDDLPQILTTRKEIRATPQFPTDMGGFWTDLSDAEARVEGKKLLQVIDQPTAELMSHWIEHGFVVLRSAASPTPMERFEWEMENMWFRGRDDLCVAVKKNGIVEVEPLRPAHRQAWHKVLNVHGASSAARDLLFSEAISRFLNHLFERPVKVYESGFYERGPSYDWQIDAAFYGPQSPMEFVGIQVVMGDKLRTSEVFHYCPKSHRNQSIASKIVGHRRLEETSKDHDAWVQRNFPQETTSMMSISARRGDVIIWHPALVHGRPQNSSGSDGRRTLIAHLCPVDVDPDYPQLDRQKSQASVLRHKGQSYFSRPTTP